MDIKKYLPLVSVSFILISLALILFFFMVGRVETTGEWRKDFKNDSVHCEKNDINYPFFSVYNSKHTEAKIDVVFEKGLSSQISLEYIQTFDNNDEVIMNEAHNHAAVNNSTGKTGVSSGLIINFSKNNNKLIMTINSNREQYMDGLFDYYFAPNVSLNSTIDDYIRNYTEQGFYCEKNNTKV